MRRLITIALVLGLTASAWNFTSSTAKAQVISVGGYNYVPYGGYTAPSYYYNTAYNITPFGYTTGYNYWYSPGYYSVPGFVRYPGNVYPSYGYYNRPGGWYGRRWWR